MDVLRLGQPRFQNRARPHRGHDLARDEGGHGGFGRREPMHLVAHRAPTHRREVEIRQRVVSDRHGVIAEIGWRRAALRVGRAVKGDGQFLRRVLPGENDLFDPAGQLAVIGRVQHHVGHAPVHHRALPDVVHQVGVEVFARLHEAEARFDAQVVGDDPADLDVDADRLPARFHGPRREILVDREFDPALVDDPVEFPPDVLSESVLRFGLRDIVLATRQGRPRESKTGHQARQSEQACHGVNARRTGRRSGCRPPVSTWTDRRTGCARPRRRRNPRWARPSRFRRSRRCRPVRP